MSGLQLGPFKMGLIVLMGKMAQGFQRLSDGGATALKVVNGRGEKASIFSQWFKHFLKADISAEADVRLAL